MYHIFYKIQVPLKDKHPGEEDTLSKDCFHKLIILGAAFLGVWIFIRFLFPFFLPFLVGLLLAGAVDPAVEFLEKKIFLPRWTAAAAAVTAGFLMLFLLLLLPGAALLRQLGQLAPLAARFRQAAALLLEQLEAWLLERCALAPEPLDSLLEEEVFRLFSSGAAVMERAARALPGLATSLLGRVADWAVQLGTAFLAAVMFSVRLPRLRRWLDDALPERFRMRYLPMLRTLKSALAGWFRAQLALFLVAAALLLAGFLLLGVSPAPLWALGVALVDAVPMLGTGTVLVPWSLLSLAQGDRFRFWGLLLTYAVTALSRSALEPRLLGRSMGLDPLAALAAVYVGLRLWGLAGMILLPLAASCALQLGRMNSSRNL